MSEYAPRKKPQQERSRRTYEAIVDTAADLLVELGYHNMSTNKIAERADVSVGSVYQYFPNKEAIVRAVMDEFAERQYEILADGLEEVQGVDLRDAVRKLVDNMLQTKRDEPELSRVLFEQLPPIGQHDVMSEWTQRAATLLRSALEDRDEELRPGNLDIAAFVLVNGVHGIVQGAVSNWPEMLDDERLLDETADMVLRYLEGS